MRQKRRSYRDYDDDEDAISDNLAAVNERLDDLTRQLERIAQLSSAARSGTSSTGEPVQDRVSEALARLDRRLDQVISEGRAASSKIERRVRFAPPPAPAPEPAASARGPASWAAQISARQRALDGAASAAPPAMPAAPQPAAAQGPPYHVKQRQSCHSTEDARVLGADHPAKGEGPAGRRPAGHARNKGRRS